MGHAYSSCDLLALLKEVFVEETHALIFHALAELEVCPEEGPQNGNEVSKVVLKAGSEPGSLVIEPLELHKEGIIYSLESAVKHHAIDVVVHGQLQAVVDHDSGCGRIRIGLEVSNGRVDLLLPMNTRLLYNLVVEEGDIQNASHLPPMVAIEGMGYVLALASENVEHVIVSA